MIHQIESTATDAVHAYARLLLQLHRLIADGNGDSDEADALRDHMDVFWKQLNGDESQLVRQLSEDLYSLHTETSNPRDTDVYSPGLATDVVHANESRDYLRALRLLNQHPADISYDRALVIRGMCYRELGLVGIALAFIRRAAESSRDPDGARVIELNTLWHYVNLDEAVGRAAEFFQRNYASSYKLKFIMACIFLTAAPKKPVATQATYAAWSKSLFIEILKEFDQFGGSVSEIAQCHELLSQSYYILGETPEALKELESAIRIKPSDEALYVQRGLITMDSDFQAAKRDFEMAATLYSSSVWPYYYLAFDALKSRDYDRCKHLADEALARAMNLEMQATLHSWIAMSTASASSVLNKHLIDLVRKHFKTALSLSPTDSTILANSNMFESALNEAILQHRWSIGMPISSMEASTVAFDKRLPQLAGS